MITRLKESVFSLLPYFVHIDMVLFAQPGYVFQVYTNFIVDLAYCEFRWGMARTVGITQLASDFQASDIDFLVSRSVI